MVVALQRLAVMVNRNTKSTLALAQKAYSVGGMRVNIGFTS
jgi:hypothetical protein